MNKNSPSILRRQEEIAAIIRGQEIHSQDELLTVLRKRGFRVTQPTLSRDLRDLGLAKTASGYVLPSDLAGASTVVAFIPKEKREEKLHQLVRDSVTSVIAAGNLVVVRTPPASAQPVASALDTASLPDVLGTIGGDDTIFVAVKTAAAADQLARLLQTIIGSATSRRRARS